MGGQEHFYMETQSMLVVPVGEETEFNVYVSSQWPTLTQVRRDVVCFQQGGRSLVLSVSLSGRTRLLRRWTSRPTESPAMSKGLEAPSEGRSPKRPSWPVSPQWLRGSKSQPARIRTSSSV